MLGNTDSAANVAVKDIEGARKFYQGTLGLEEVDSEGTEMVVVFKSGSTRLIVYRSEFAGTNKATAVTWAVGDRMESVMRALKDKGVTFEHYDLPGVTREGDVHAGGGAKTAWFKDPEGNILNLIDR